MSVDHPARRRARAVDGERLPPLLPLPCPPGARVDCCCIWSGVRYQVISVGVVWDSALSRGVTCVGVGLQVYATLNFIVDNHV